ncbi:MAG TPA: hypothetical protein VIB48_01340 [Acidimicrobiia bacterium]|jgi:hypothetical protein
MSSACDVPTAHTPPGGYGEVMPPPVLSGCDEPLAESAPDLRGLWRAVDVQTEAAPLPADHRLRDHIERIEQAGNRVVVTAGGVVHDMVADGTFENGVNDVMAADFVTPISVAATFEHEALVLRPRGMPGVEVRRWREGEQLLWRYDTQFTMRMERVDDGVRSASPGLTTD